VNRFGTLVGCTFYRLIFGDIKDRIIIGSDRWLETKQGKIVRFRSGRVRDTDRDRRSEAINFVAC